MNLPDFPPLPKLPPAPWQSLKESDDERLGCVVADESLLVLAYLEKLADGWNHFGVLRVGRDRLRRATDAAQRLNEHELSRALSEFSTTLADVRDEPSARRVAIAFRPYAEQAWKLGAMCKGLDADTVLEVGRQIAEGRLSRDEAVERVLEE